MKIILRVSLLVALVLSLTHQSHAVLPFSLGFKGGTNIANLSIDPDNLSAQGITKSTRLALIFGAVAELGVGGPIYIVLEPSYVQKGAKLEGQGGKLTFEGNYLAIPLLVKAKFGVATVKPYVFAGPNLGLLLSAKQVVEAQGQTQETDIKESFTSTDFAIDFGGGVQFKVAKLVAVTADARYSLGLSDINKDSTDPTKIKTTGIQILLGVLFTI
ncbi:MAG: PorT family protein [Ignavibacteria bacterium]|nr:PorT family protein [Ignavibacteria bacterium]